MVYVSEHYYGPVKCNIEIVGNPHPGLVCQAGIGVETRLDMQS